MWGSVGHTQIRSELTSVFGITPDCAWGENIWGAEDRTLVGHARQAPHLYNFSIFSSFQDCIFFLENILFINQIICEVS